MKADVNKYNFYTFFIITGGALTPLYGGKYTTRLLFFPMLKDLTDQMAEWYRASASESVDSGFDYESGQTNNFKIGIHSFPA